MVYRLSYMELLQKIGAVPFGINVLQLADMIKFENDEVDSCV